MQGQSLREMLAAKPGGQVNTRVRGNRKKNHGGGDVGSKLIKRDVMNKYPFVC